METFLESAQAVAALDRVITVDTSVTHLAGARGSPIWLMLPFAADWRWFRDRTISSQYPTMRLFRQGKAGDWPPVVDDVVVALTAWRP